MALPEILFWSCAAAVVYTYLGYPLLLAAAACLRRRPPAARQAAPGTVSVVLAVHNEEAAIDRRLAELIRLVTASGLKGEVIVVSDGSTDGTALLARAHAKTGVRVVELPARVGKAAALTAGCAQAVHEVIVFADARQTWDPAALRRLVGNFADPAVGAVSGDLVVESSPGVLAGVGLYWRYEKWLRKMESRVHSTVGVTGAICAVRRELFGAIPRGTILDDVYWPLRVAMQGHRVVHDEEARAYDRLPDRARDEFRRKVRTLAGNYQLAWRLPGALLPWRNPIWFQFLSHKVLRLAVPWALGTMLVASALSPAPLFRFLFWNQVLFYGLGLAGLWKPAGVRVRPASMAASFLVLNAAAWVAFWVWASGKASRSWRKVSYKLKPLGCPGDS